MEYVIEKKPGQFRYLDVCFVQNTINQVNDSNTICTDDGCLLENNIYIKKQKLFNSIYNKPKNVILIQKNEILKQTQEEIIILQLYKYRHPIKLEIILEPIVIQNVVLYVNNQQITVSKFFLLFNLHMNKHELFIQQKHSNALTSVPFGYIYFNTYQQAYLNFSSIKCFFYRII